MIKTLLCCNHCGERVKWLYKYPRCQKAGLNVEFDNGNPMELCEKCLDNLIQDIKEYSYNENAGECLF